jgi:3-hydroxymyristoyl/3-hydroxydecanoyl-(acyl carrier protein) dehydratase
MRSWISDGNLIRKYFITIPTRRRKRCLADWRRAAGIPAAVSMRLFVDTMDVAGGIIGMGVDELKWPNAVRPGDELRLEIEILEARQFEVAPGLRHYSHS